MSRAQKLALSRQVMFVLSLRRRAMTEKKKATYLEGLINLFEDSVWRPLRVKGPLHIYGSLYFDRRRHSFTRETRKGVFESMTYVKVARGYRLADIENGLRHALANQKKGKRK